VYEHFFGLRERPFDLTPNPRFLYLTGRHREALSTLQYGITGRKGITLLIGEAGTGKTTLVRAAVDALAGRDTLSIYVSNPALTRAEFYELLASRCGFCSGESKARFLVDLEHQVLARHEAGGVTALVIDEAQSLPPELLEEVRLLANIETASEKLLPVVLAGQPELAQRLEEPAFRQLKQRIALRCELGALTIQETAAYISGRIRIAGGDSAKTFTREAVQAVHEYSRGIPRTISVISDNALVSGFATNVKPIGSGIVREVCRDLGLTKAYETELRVVGRQQGPASGPRAAQRETIPLRVTQPPRDTRSGPQPIVPGHAEPQSAGGGLFSHFGRRRRFFFF
jgi:type II secretory pathway predicted ATPase ExeA